MKYILKSLKIIGYLLLFLVSYAAIVTLISKITVNSDCVKPNQGVTIYIKSNGVHTDIVVPVKNNIKNWNEVISINHTQQPDTTAQYVGLGWGDKGFYLDTPTWADLKVSTALKAVSGFNTTAIHATFYKKLQENQNCKKVVMSTNDYEKLVLYIEDSFQIQKEKVLLIPTKSVYGTNDAFYEAKGHYSLFYTCNSWANQALKAAHQKAALWTISDTGILQHYNN